MKLIKNKKKKISIVESYGCSYTCSESHKGRFNGSSGSACGK